MSTGLSIFLFIVLLVLTAFFVATEFAIIKVRPSRVDQMVMEGAKNALAVQKVTGNLDGYLSACQLGITITALGLGWLGEPTVEVLLHPIFASLAIPDQLVSLLSFLIAFLIVTYLHVVLGELAPKTLAIQKAEAVTVLLARPIIWFYHIMYPFIWLLNGSANKLVRLFGLRPAKEHEEAHSEEELRIILSDSYKSGKINQTEFGYVSRIFAFDDLLAREIMVPRTDMICLDIEDPLDKNLKIMKEEQYTRFPLIRENKDTIIGMVNTKQFFLRFDDNPELSLEQVMLPVLSVPESTPVKTLLKKMQHKRAHIAILVDEYGGTSGMVSIEDILEEIVGDIRDEFDAQEKREVEKIADGHYIIDGKVSLHHINELFNVIIESEEMDTIGGWLYGQNPEIRKGSTLQFEQLQFTVLEKEKHRIRKIEIRNADPVADSLTEPPAAQESRNRLKDRLGKLK
ncbi:hemolysin family protein [Paenibacillus senegalensis]|uniref:hemolysin family protein n=1 Tax=Paenibacillus senegalensis TaxID=1465766 RepID=UPI000287CFA3|nr:hemolysin family protein [Paenibacillus senegalensis]